MKTNKYEKESSHFGPKNIQLFRLVWKLERSIRGQEKAFTVEYKNKIKQDRTMFKNKYIMQKSFNGN